MESHGSKYTIEYGQISRKNGKYEVVFAEWFDEENETYVAFVRALHLLHRECDERISFSEFLDQGVKHLRDIIEFERTDPDYIMWTFLMHSHCLNDVYFNWQGQDTIETIRVYEN